MVQKKNKSIVIINQDSGYLMIDIANAHVKKGYSVSLVTGRLVERNNKLNSKINVSKIISYNRNSSFKRIVTWAIGTFQILFYILSKYRNEHLIITSNPPFSTLITLIIKNSYSLLIYDVYPDVLVEYKILKENSFFIKKWKKANKSIFKKASKIFTLTEGMRDRLTQYTSKDKIEVVPIWTDNTFLKPVEKKKNSFLIEHNLQDKFIIMYSGNLGKTHNIEILIELAEKLQEEPYYIMIIGGGDKYESMKNEITNRKLNNIKLLPWQPVNKLPYTLAGADIGVVSLGTEASNLSIPSKTYNLMSVGVPILSISNDGSALAKLILENEIGRNFGDKDLTVMVEYIKLLNNDKDKKEYYRSKALKASTMFSPKNALKFIENV